MVNLGRNAKIRSKYMKNLLMIALFVVSVTVSVSAKVLTVDDNFAECKKAQFSSIQAAVDSAAPGDKIKVCPGVYSEHVTITKSDLSLFSEKPLQAIIKAPAIPDTVTDYAIVRVTGGAQNVQLRGFTITGPLPDALFCSTSIQSGVRIQGGASAEIIDNHITEIRSTNPALRGCQNGIAIAVGRHAESQTGFGVIRMNLIDKYQKGGIYVDNVGSGAEIVGNDIVGNVGTPDSDVIASNGIQISSGATAEIRNNDVTGNVYSPQTWGGSGIYLWDTGEVSVRQNGVTNNDFGIVLDALANGVANVSDNNASNSTWDGISVYGTEGAVVAHNTANNNGYDGIYAFTDSLNNLFEHNKMSGNAVFDAEDVSVGASTGGTANVWKKNKCVTDNRGGALCEK
jgi:parallel beta-helix repeat protein